MRKPSSPRPHRAPLYVAAGLLAGLGYALLNTETDAWANAGAIGRAFVAFHAFVDRGIPLIAGALLGLAFHWLHLRARLARAESARADELRSRLRHVERDQAVWVVVASALHELKNPLHALGLMVDELDEVVKTRDASAITEHVARVRALMDRTLVPLEALRSLTRREQRADRSRRLGETVVEVVAALRPVAADAGVTLRIEGDVDAAAPVDPEYVRIILDNLVGNALEVRGEGGHAREVVVRIVDDRDSGRVRVRVCDDGPGFPESGRASMFEPLHPSTTEGLGLGLPIARALARILGGELEPADVPGFATAFDLVVPRAMAAR